MSFLAQIIAWINVPINALGNLLMGWIGTVPGWLSNTIISAVTGVVLLIIWKYTSNQSAIGRVRDAIKADMLALKLFKDSISVTLRAQGRVFAGAGKLLVHALRPMMVIIIPVCLLFSQMGLWYQSRPLLPGEETIVRMKLNSSSNLPLSEVNIESIPGAEIVTGPVRVFSKRQIFWQIKARQNGNHRIIFKAGQQQIEKQLAIGDGFMRVSVERPAWYWTDIMRNPAEKPFAPDSVVQSISINYPDRPSRTSGTNWWVGYFFVASMAFALIFKPFLKVRF